MTDGGKAVYVFTPPPRQRNPNEPMYKMDQFKTAASNFRILPVLNNITRAEKYYTCRTILHVLNNINKSTTVTLSISRFNDQTQPA